MAITLDFVEREVTTAASTAAGNLETALTSLSSGGSLSVEGMLGLQFQMSKYTLVVSVGSSVTKEITDTMKSVVQKIQ